MLHNSLLKIQHWILWNKTMVMLLQISHLNAMPNYYQKILKTGHLIQKFNLWHQVRPLLLPDPLDCNQLFLKV
jgi:hypothetical protein